MLRSDIEWDVEWFLSISTIYKEQGKNNIETPFKSMAVSADIKYDLKIFDKVSSDMLGVGLLFYNDRIDIYDFNTSAIELSVAFHKSLGYKNKQYLSIGFSGRCDAKKMLISRISHLKICSIRWMDILYPQVNRFYQTILLLPILPWVSITIILQIRNFQVLQVYLTAIFAQPNISFLSHRNKFQNNTSNLRS
ncbi:MAG: hypothetical protein R2771_13850 [Saprospiraceae bacterium]